MRRQPLKMWVMCRTIFLGNNLIAVFVIESAPGALRMGIFLMIC